MPKISNRSIIDDRFKDDEFKDKEVSRFETKFPGARVVKDEYNNERELEEDWEGYCSLPYSLKVLCNEICLRLYGCKNEEQYLRLKAKFLREDISRSDLIKSNYRPAGLIEGADAEFLNKQAQEYMDHGGHSLLKTDYESLSDLNKAYYNFHNQCDDHKRIANDKSRELWGKTVPEVYDDEVHKFLRQDINNSDYDSGIRPVVVDSLSATEAVLASITDDHTDLIESVLITEMAASRITTPVEDTLVSMMEDICIARADVVNRPLGFVRQFFLPWEIMGMIEETDPMFLNYYARNLGIKPPRKEFYQESYKILDESSDKNSLLSIGWNPAVPVTGDSLNAARDRCNRIMEANIHYKVIDFSKTPNMLTEGDMVPNKPKGISAIIISELDCDHKEAVQDVPNVLVSFDQDDPVWYTVIYGQLSYRQDVDSVLKQYSCPSASCYFLQTSDQLHSALKDHIHSFNQNNEIQKVTMALQAGAPEIANKSLFIMNLMNSIIYPQYGDLPFPIRLNDKGNGTKDIINLIYSGMNPTWNQIHDAYSKLSIYEKNTDLKESFLFENTNLIAEEADQIPEFDPKSLSESVSVYSDKWGDFKKIFDIELQSSI